MKDGFIDQSITLTDSSNKIVCLLIVSMNRAQLSSLILWSFVRNPFDYKLFVIDNRSSSLQETHGIIIWKEGEISLFATQNMIHSDQALYLNSLKLLIHEIYEW